MNNRRLFPLMLLLVALPARAETSLTTVRVASGLSLPLFATSPPGDTTRLFIVEQREGDAKGRIKILRNGTVLPTQFLTTTTLATGNEQGLLGLAFAPDYATSGRFYVNYTDSTWATRVVRFTVSGNPDIANPTGEIILSIPQPYNNHNGGWLGFGPDGYLYVATGDGGNGNDPEDRAQNVDSLLGKMLRLDVSGASSYTIPPTNPFAGSIPGRDEIWAFGLRNPWRPSFDRETGDLVIADVGQSQFEEVNAPTKAAGVNYGWRCFEGFAPYLGSNTTPCTSCSAPGCTVLPAYAYDHTLSRCSITGGYVYRGCAIPDLRGTYFFADYCGKQIYTGHFQDGALVDFRDRTSELAPAGFTIGNITSFGEDARGELYIVDQQGQVFKVVPSAPVAESDMPVLRTRTALGDTLGSTSPGNALTPGITAFADPGSRVRGMGYLKNALLRDCTGIAGNCLTAKATIGAFNVDLSACVDSAAATLTRRFVFTNTSGSAQPLAYVDVVAPQLRQDANTAMIQQPAGGGHSAVLVQADWSAPDRWIVHSGTGSAGVTYSADVDTASQLNARVAADQPLGGNSSTGPATVAMALGFDFGTVAPAAPETVTVVTHLQNVAPSGVTVDESVPARGELKVLSGIPFRSDVRLELALRRSGEVALDVFDPSGRLVRTLRRGAMSAGRTFASWDGKLDGGVPAPSGIYFIQLRTQDSALRQRVVLLR